jgi:hypothetical protein
MCFDSYRNEWATEKVVAWGSMARVELLQWRCLSNVADEVWVYT